MASPKSASPTATMVSTALSQDLHDGWSKDQFPGDERVAHCARARLQGPAASADRGIVAAGHTVRTAAGGHHAAVNPQVRGRAGSLARRGGRSLRAVGRRGVFDQPGGRLHTDRHRSTCCTWGTVAGSAPGGLCRHRKQTLVPGLRLGWLIMPDHLVDDVQAAKVLADRGSPVIDQLTFADFLARGEFDRRLRRMRPIYRRRRDTQLQALHQHAPDLIPTGISAGLQLVTWLQHSPSRHAGRWQLRPSAARSDTAPPQPATTRHFKRGLDRCDPRSDQMPELPLRSPRGLRPGPANASAGRRNQPDHAMRESLGTGELSNLGDVRRWVSDCCPSMASKTWPPGALRRLELVPWVIFGRQSGSERLGYGQRGRARRWR